MRTSLRPERRSAMTVGNAGQTNDASLAAAAECRVVGNDSVRQSAQGVNANRHLTDQNSDPRIVQKARTQRRAGLEHPIRCRTNVIFPTHCFPRKRIVKLGKFDVATPLLMRKRIWRWANTVAASAGPPSS